MESVFDTLEREADFDRTRDLNLPPTSSSVPVSRNLKECHILLSLNNYII